MNDEKAFYELLAKAQGLAETDTEKRLLGDLVWFWHSDRQETTPQHFIRLRLDEFIRQRENG